MAATSDTSSWPAARRFIGGYFSGCALVLAGHPFDTIKVRLQTQGRSGRFTGVLDCVKQTVRHEGFFGLYKGVTPPLLATGVINSILFGLQGLVVSAIKDPNAARPEVTDYSKAAIVTGAMIATIVTPVEGVKARLQVQYSSGHRRYNGPIHCIQRVVTEQGLTRGLYRGFVPTCLCRMSNWAYFGPYEAARRYFAREDGKLSMGASVAAGGIAGVSYWFSCFPIDVIKNRMQASADTAPELYSSMRSTARHIYATDGVRGFFAGFLPCIIRAAPANAAAFTAYEIIMSLLPERL